MGVLGLAGLSGQRGDGSAPHGWARTLTYARRYALFTLVGIAGEDDLDTPDLPLSGPPMASSPDKVNGHALDPGRGANGDGRRKPRRVPSRVTLGPEASAALRKQLVAGWPGWPGQKTWIVGPKTVYRPRTPSSLTTPARSSRPSRASSTPSGRLRQLRAKRRPRRARLPRWLG